MKSRVLILDDDPESRASLNRSVQLGGLTTVAATGPFQSLDDLCKFAMKEEVTHVLTDHRLRERPFSSFLGAAAAATLYALKIAPVLVTAYAVQDMDLNIRPYLGKIPQVLDRRTESSPKAFRAALEMAEREVFHDDVARTRRTCRSLIQVAEIIELQGQKQVRFEVRQWRKDETVGFPFDQLPAKIQEALKTELFLIGQVNIEADRPEDLFLLDLELCPTDDSDVI